MQFNRYIFTGSPGLSSSQIMTRPVNDFFEDVATIGKGLAPV